MPAHADCVIADYGSRRRFSRDWQEEVLLTMQGTLGHQMAGTSNVHFARQHKMIPLGTMAHEYLQACQSLGPRLRDSQCSRSRPGPRYRGDLGIALSDTYGFDAFLRDFDLYFCKLFDGVRHDSGDPVAWGERMLAHYAANRVDARSRTLIFSDSLDIPRVIELFERFRGRCRLAFGVGTNLTNDWLYTAADRHQDGPLQRAASGQAVGCAGEDHVRRSGLRAYLRRVFGIDSRPV